MTKGRHFTLARVIGGFCFLLAPVGVLSSHSLVVVLALALLLGLAAAWREGRLRGLLQRLDRPLFGACLLVLAWAAVTMLWTISPGDAASPLLRLFILVPAGLLLVELARSLEPGERAQVGRWLLAGFAAGVALFLFERFSDHWLHYLVSEREEERSELSILNRGATAISLLVWPATAALWRLGVGRWSLALPPLVFALLLLSESAAALLGVAAGYGFLLLALGARGLGRERLPAILLSLALAGGLLGAPALAQLIFTPDAYDVEAETGIVDYSAQYRLYIWEYSANRTAERPLLGWGFDSSPRIKQPAEKRFEWEPVPIPSHPHNAALQVWLELGGVGALLTTGLLLLLTVRANRLGAALGDGGLEGPAAQALLLASFAVACVSYGIWQNQWIAALLAGGLAAVAVRGPWPSDRRA